MGELLSINELSKLLGESRSKIKKWIEKDGLRVLSRMSRGHKLRKYTYIDTDDFWYWLKKHPHLLDISNISVDTIPDEPEWVKDYRK